MCPLCDSSEREVVVARDGERRIVKCRTCDLAYVNPQPDDHSLGEMYASGYFQNDDGRGYTNYEALSTLLTQIAESNIVMLEEHHDIRTVLDVGCATGEFLEAAEAHGWDACGVEFSREAASICRDKGLRLLGSTVQEVPQSAIFDVVTYWDVLEHVRDPLGELRCVAGHLGVDGVFATTMPNYGSLRSRLQRGRWWAFYSSREHLWFFSVRSLRRILERAGFEVVFAKSTTIDVLPDLTRLAKDLARHRDRVGDSFRFPSVSYFPSRSWWRRALERRLYGHVLFLVARKRAASDSL
jgi:2-polyprenyl-3-methyl-5-hydroxy-6-metoxy-1,4-benzoquinol methylase